MSERKEEWLAIGIDLGTKYSCVAVWKNGRIEIITNDQDNRTTPSSVAFTDTMRLIGEVAVNQGRLNPNNTIFDKVNLNGLSSKLILVDQAQPCKLVMHRFLKTPSQACTKKLIH